MPALVWTLKIEGADPAPIKSLQAALDSLKASAAALGGSGGGVFGSGGAAAATTAVLALQTAQERLNAAAGATLQAELRLDQQLTRNASSIQQLATATAVAQAAQTRATSAGEALSRAQNLTAVSATQVATAAERLAAAEAQTEAAENRAAQSAVRLQQAQTQLAAGHAQIGQAAQTHGKSLTDFFEHAASAAAGFLAANVFQRISGEIVALGTQALGLAGNLEQMRGAFTAVLGSTQAADAELAQLRAFSDKAPLFDTTNTQHFAQMLAGAGEQAQRLLPDLKAIGAVVTGTGGGTKQLEDAALAYTQVLTLGKLAGQEANQFANANIPIWRVVAEGLGISLAAAKDLSAQGKITADVFQQVFATYAVSHFADSLANAGDSFQGIQAQLRSGWQNALTEFGQGLEVGVKPALLDIANTLQDPKTLAQIQQWGIAAGQFVGQLWQGAKVVAEWAGLTLPALPAVPDYSGLRLTTSDIANNLRSGAAAARDVDGEIASLQSRVSNIREQEAAYNTGIEQQLGGIRAAQAAYDAGIDNRLAGLREQARLLDQAFQSEKARKELNTIGTDIARDRMLAVDVVSAQGQAAAKRLKTELARQTDLQDTLAHDQAKNALTNQEAGLSNQKRITDQNYQAQIRGIEATKQAQDAYFAGLVRGYERQIATLQTIKKTAETPPDLGPHVAAWKAAGDDISDRYQGTSASTIEAMTRQYAQFYGTTLPTTADTARPLIFTALFGTPGQQSDAGVSLAQHFADGLTAALPTIAAAGLTIGATLIRSLDSAFFGQKGTAADNSIFSIFDKIGKGDWAGAAAEWSAAKSRDNGTGNPWVSKGDLSGSNLSKPGTPPTGVMTDPNKPGWVMNPDGKWHYDPRYDPGANQPGGGLRPDYTLPGTTRASAPVPPYQGPGYHSINSLPPQSSTQTHVHVTVGFDPNGLPQVIDTKITNAITGKRLATILGGYASSAG